MAARFIIFALLFVLAGATLGQWIAADSGYILISFRGVSLETSLWVGIITFILCATLLWVVYRVVKGMVILPSRIQNRITLGKNKKSTVLLRQALLWMAAGSYNQVYRSMNALLSNNSSLEALILGAEVCLHNKNYKELIDIVGKIRGHGSANPEEKDNAVKAADILLARSYKEQKNYEQALKLLAPYNDDAKSESFIAEMLKELYVQSGKWDKFADLLIITRGEDEERKDDLLLYFNHASDIGGLKKLWKSLNSRIKKKAELIAAYALACYKLGDKAEAEELLRKEIQNNYAPGLYATPLVDAYKSILSERPLHQLQFLEELKEKGKYKIKHGKEGSQNGGSQNGGSQNESLLAALAELSVRNDLIPKAREYYADLLRVNPNADPKVHIEYAKLLEKSNSSVDKNKAPAIFRSIALKQE